MNWKAFHIDFPEGRFAFQEKGAGNQLLLCLHGYRQRKEMFHPLFGTVPSGWKIILMDLPLFGETTWHNPKAGISPAFLRQLWQALLQRFPQGQWHVLGFSMGGKIAMALQLAAPRPAAVVILLAPDGIRPNPWHRFVSSRPGQYFLHRLNQHSAFVLSLSQWLYDRKWLSTFSYRFAQRNFASAELRELLETQIRLYAPLHFRLASLVQHSRQYPTQWHILWGEQDRVIPWQTALVFQKRLPETQLHLIPAGHMILDQNLPVAQKMIFHILRKKNELHS